MVALDHEPPWDSERLDDVNRRRERRPRESDHPGTAARDTSTAANSNQIAARQVPTPGATSAVGTMAENAAKVGNTWGLASKASNLVTVGASFTSLGVRIYCAATNSL